MWRDRTTGCSSLSGDLSADTYCWLMDILCLSVSTGAKLITCTELSMKWRIVCQERLWIYLPTTHVYKSWQQERHVTKITHAPEKSHLSSSLLQAWEIESKLHYRAIFIRIVPVQNILFRPNSRSKKVFKFSWILLQIIVSIVKRAVVWHQIS